MRARSWYMALVLLAGAMPVYSLAPQDLWLYIERDTASQDICRQVEAQTFIYSDGLVVMRTKGRAGVVTLFHATAPSEAIRDLQNALGQNRVGFVKGNCALDFARQPGDYVGLAITWLGKPPRRNTFTLTSPVGGPCPARETAIFQALERFIGVILSEPSREVVEIQLGPIPPYGRK